MSAQAVINFIIKVNQDTALYEKVNSLPSSRIDPLIDIARDAGFEFTADEFTTTVLEHSRKSGELQEDDLENVAGGALNAYVKLSPSESFSLNFSKIEFNKFG